MLDCATWSELCARPLHKKTEFRPHLFFNISYQILYVRISLKYYLFLIGMYFGRLSSWISNFIRGNRLIRLLLAHLKEGIRRLATFDPSTNPNVSWISDYQVAIPKLERILNDSFSEVLVDSKVIWLSHRDFLSNRAKNTSYSFLLCWHLC